MYEYPLLEYDVMLGYDSLTGPNSRGALYKLQLQLANNNLA